ncbi:uncharacterized protein LOC103716287 [Phoenix dactylifera]|uniref:Uncharacterized protein LOC103716287 n=1 Tax=Phoenix dactylifera TaxID=42345 RepID=A0A8B7CMM9_PHODC|nr:uncharacterized protein LOC103716287 [Phoenix dactylifera]
MRRTTYTEKLAAIALGLLAVLSPLYIDRKPPVEPEYDDGYGSLAMWLPFVLIVLIVVINFTCFLDRRFTRFDPYWIHRVGGSSCGIIAILLVLGFVLKCKASLKS